MPKFISLIVNCLIDLFSETIRPIMWASIFPVVLEIIGGSITLVIYVLFFMILSKGNSSPASSSPVGSRIPKWVARVEATEASTGISSCLQL